MAIIALQKHTYEGFAKLKPLMTRKVLDCIFKVRFLNKDCPKYAEYDKALVDATITPGKKIKGGKPSTNRGTNIELDLTTL